MFEGKISNPGEVQELLETESFLGGQKVEGLVFKRRSNAIFGRDAKPLIAKYVSEAFRETHQKKQYKVPKQEVIGMIIEIHRTEARWQKAVQHVREDGKLEQSPRDIGKLIAEVQRDLVAECSDEIKNMLFDHFVKQIQRGVIRGLPEWYKDQLLQMAFDKDA